MCLYYTILESGVVQWLCDYKPKLQSLRVWAQTPTLSVNSKEALGMFLNFSQLDFPMYKVDLMIPILLQYYHVAQAH